MKSQEALAPGKWPERFSVRAYGVLRRGDKVLMTRSTFMDRTFLNFPGGGVDVGEAPVEGLKREFREETGLEARIKRLLYVSEGLHVSTNHPIQLVSLYWEVSADGEPRPGANGDDVLCTMWRTIGDFPREEMFPSDLEFIDRLPGLL
ncbi:MAG: NUDIX hydrolase [Elusimicrobia bacterium]|nr:NUDIX hydrolase [Elusimicrobiota bacterium]